MNAFDPIDITAAILTSTTLSEPQAGSPDPEPIYSTGTTYALDGVAIDTATHLKYRSLVASNLNNALTDTTKWECIGATNKWAMFDTTRNVQSEGTSPLTVVLTPGERFDSLALTGMEADQLDITITSVIGGGTVYSETVDLLYRSTVSWYTYFHGAFYYKSELLRTDLPPFSDAIITLTLTNAGSPSTTVKCGPIGIGMKEYLGEVELGANSDRRNYSTVNRDASTGFAALDGLRNIPLTRVESWLPRERLERVRKFGDVINGRSIVWAGIDDDTDGYFGTLFTLGFARQFSINLDQPEEVRLSLQVESI